MELVENKNDLNLIYMFVLRLFKMAANQIEISHLFLGS